MAEEREAPREAPEERELPQAVARKRGPRTFQFVWLIPMLALLVGGWIALKSVLDRGPTISIQFRSAEGIEPGKTKIRHKSVDIGTVKRIQLTTDHKAVIVTAEMDRQVADGFLVDDTRFWVVRPRIGGGQVTGLGTLLAGSYIAVDPGASKEERRQFAGLESPPGVTSDLPGKRFQLLADDLGSLDVGSTVYYRGVVAGSVVSTEVPKDGTMVLLSVYVNAPYDAFVNGDTRFWNASGIDVTLDTTGVKVQTQSLFTLVMGGISFETPAGNARAPLSASNAQFTLWTNRGEAMKPRETVVDMYTLKFPQSVRGLAVGSTVDFRGITVGEVKRIDLEFEPASVKFQAVVEIAVYPERLRSRFRNGARPWADLTSSQRMARFVERGFRAQLRSANLLTGQLFIALDFFEKEPRAVLDTTRTPPEIPTVKQGGLGELQESLARIVAKVEKIPFEELASDLRRTLKDLGTTLKRAEGMIGTLNDKVAPELRATIEQARKTLGSAETVLGTDSPLQGDLRDTLNDVSRTADSLRELVDYLERHPESLIRGKRPAGEKK